VRSQQPPRWRPPGPPTSIVIYPDPHRDCWRHTQSVPDMGILDGYLHLPASALPVEARQAAEIMLADAGRTYYDLDLISTGTQLTPTTGSRAMSAPPGRRTIPNSAMPRGTPLDHRNAGRSSDWRQLRATHWEPPG
jgi:hypothetical protein